MKKLITLAAAALLWGQANAQVPCSGIHVCIPDTTSSSCLNAAAAATGGTGSWSSSNSSIATVSSTGTITGVSAGWATISYVVVYTETVKVNPLPVAAPYYDTLVCTGGNLKLYAGDTGEAPANTYAWTGPNSFSSTARNPVITGATASANGTYTLTITAESCSRTYTLSTTVHSSSFYSVSVNQTAPFTLVGQRVHTRTSSAFTLQAVTSPALPSSGTSYTWAGYVPGSAEYFAPTSGFPTSSVVGVYPYTVTVTHNGCSASVPDTIVIPPSGSCTPENYFSVNGYRKAKGLDTLTAAVCSDCSTVQPYVTILGNRISSANVGRKTNYYIAGLEVTCDMDLLDSNNFFMADSSRLIIDTNRAVTINHCHFYSCKWRGILVRTGVAATGRVNIVNNTLIENSNSIQTYLYPAVVVAKKGNGNYYTPGMADILSSDGAIYNQNAYGISLTDYNPSIATATPGTRLPFTVRNSVFINRELASKDNASTSADNFPFAWPSAKSLKAVVTPGNTPQFASSTYRSGNGVSYMGLYIVNVGSSSSLTSGNSTTPATYGYNKVVIGSQSNDANYDSTNLCDSLWWGVYNIASNVHYYNNTIRKAFQYGIYIAGTSSSSIYQVCIEGDSSAHTNNRIYTANKGILINANAAFSAPWDFSCRHTCITNTSSDGIGIGEYLGRNKFEVIENYIYNAGNSGIRASNFTSPILPKGTTIIRKNFVVAKTTVSGLETGLEGIYVGDGVNADIGASNGEVTIDSNTIIGVKTGVRLEWVQRKAHINDNDISVFAYSAPKGVDLQYAFGLLEMKRNKVAGLGYCLADSNAVAYLSDSSGRSDVDRIDMSCNLAMDISRAFAFQRGNFVDWRRNEMRRCKNGLYFVSASTSIGQQGDVCEPTDNRWTANACGGAASCSGCSTFTAWSGAGITAISNLSGANLSLSKIYVRNTTTWAPPSVSGSPAYSFASGTLVDASSGCGSMPDSVICGPAEEAGRAAITAPAIGGSNTMVSRFRSNMTLFPNPTEGTVTVAITDATDGPVKVRVMNALGVEVYNGTHTFTNGQTDVHLQRMAPGMYTVQLTGSNGSVNTGKVVLVK